MRLEPDDIKGYLRPDVRERLHVLIGAHAVRTVIEVGSFIGQSAIWFAQRVDSVVCVDPFDLERGSKATMGHKREAYEAAGYSTQYETFLANTLAYPNIRAVKLLSHEAARLPLEADLVFIDGSHLYEDVKSDIEMWRPKALKVLAGDDTHDPRYGVKAACEATGISHHAERCWWEIRG